jgi:hypothetical protein
VGRIVSALFKPPTMFITVTTSSGAHREFRLIPAMARAGFLLSPLIEDRTSFAVLATAQSPGLPEELDEDVVTTFTVGPRGETIPPLLYKPSFHVAFFRLQLPGHPSRDVPGLAGLTQIQALRRAALRAGRPARLLSGLAEQQVLLAEAPSELSIGVPPAAHQVTLRYGIADGAWQQGHTDGVEFRALADAGDGRRLLWSRRLNPAAASEDRGVQSADVVLPPDGRNLVLQTIPGETAAWDWSYWAAPDFR